MSREAPATIAFEAARMAAAVTPSPSSDTRSAHAARGLLVPLLVVLTAAAPPAHAADWPHGNDGSGTWGGSRTKLEEHGLHVDLDYVAETFARDFEAIGYRGNLDLMLTLDTAKAGLWKGGTVFAYGQNAHGDGISDELGFVMPVSFYEAGDFTQVSEFWLRQDLPAGIAVRLGKQDANRDFAGPRFGHNFLNSSFGVLPTTPMPSFPAPALGAALFVPVASWLEIRSGVYDGAPRVESFAGGAFEKGAGVFATSALAAEFGADGPRDLVCQLGGWHHTDLDVSGAFALADLLVHLDPHPDGSPRSLQFFARTQWEVDAPPTDAEVYAGGGVTAHGLLADEHTVGLGAGYVSLAGRDQGFVELFTKWRPFEWFSIEPDVQVYFVGADAHVLTGLRVRTKL